MEKNKGIEQAEVMRRWHEQQELPKSERDILEFRHFNDTAWIVVLEPVWNFNYGEYRLRKRPRWKTVTVYLYRPADDFLLPALVPGKDFELLGQADITYEEPDDETDDDS